ncbi:MAG: flagellar biosynthetic protein FliP, partial [Alphaproteobacteria bacterium]|nr:flagellar biosynthetic protein FliP [Alphaproteobacteria bacterium]
MRLSSLRLLPAFLLPLALLSVGSASAQELGGFPAINMTTGADGSTTYSLSLQILALMTGISLLPSLVLGMTSFTRIIIVLSILRQAMGTQQTPPNQVLIAIALFLSLFIMMPTLTRVYDDAVNPYLAQEISAEQAINDGSAIMKNFTVRNTREKDLVMFSEMAGGETFETPADVPFSIALPAFITSELKSAFQIGFLLFLPFLVIDMVIASIL